MKTDPRLIAVMESLHGRPFTPRDWDMFSGCESEDPWIAGMGYSPQDIPLVAIADGNTLAFYTDKDMMVTLRTTDEIGKIGD